MCCCNGNHLYDSKHVKSMEEELVLKNKVKLARVEKEYSQEGLASIIGVSRQTIISIEKGTYCPSTKLALILAAALDKTVEELFYLE